MAIKLIRKIPKPDKRYYLGIFAGMVIILIFAAISIFGTSRTEKLITAEADTAIKMTAESNIIYQSWQAESKNICGLRLQIDNIQSKDLQGTATLMLKQNKEDEDWIRQSSIELNQSEEAKELLFSFDQTKLELGKRYFFQIVLTDADKDTLLALKINSDYGGLSTQSEELRGGLSGTIEYEKPHNLTWLIRIFMIVTGLTGIIMIAFNRKFEETLALTFGGVFVYLYIWGVFNQLEAGVYTLFAISMLAMLSIPYLSVIKEKRLTELISPGMIAFWAVFLVYFILDRNVVAGKPDDLNHWELCVRDMWYFNSYPFHKGSVVEFLRYTPGLGTIEYLFTYLYGEFREGIVILACHTVGFSMLAVLFSKISWKYWYKMIGVGVLVAGLPLLIYQSHYEILYADAYLGIIGAYIIICYFTESKNLFNWLRITFASILLIMTKEMGVAVAATIYLMFFLDTWKHDYDKKWKVFIRGKETRKLFLSGLMAISSFVIWQGYIFLNQSKMGLQKDSNSLLKMFRLAEGILPKGAEPIQLVSATSTQAVGKALEQAVSGIDPFSPLGVIKEMAKWLLIESTFMGSPYIEVMILVILILAALGIGGIYKKLDLRMTDITIYLILGTALYTAFLTFCYIVLFNEASPIPAARRYMGTYLLLFFISLTGLILIRSNEEARGYKWQQPLFWVVCIFVYLNIPSNHPFYATEENSSSYFTAWKNHQTIGEVFNSFADKDEKIYYVEYSNSDLVPQYNYLTFFNAVTPNKTQGLSGGWKPVVNETDQFEYYMRRYTQEEWAHMLAEEYAYVYLRNIDEYFIMHYGDLFADKQEIQTGGIYRVIVNEDGRMELNQIAYKNLN